MKSAPPESRTRRSAVPAAGRAAPSAPEHGLTIILQRLAARLGAEECGLVAWRQGRARRVTASKRPLPWIPQGGCRLVQSSIGALREDDYLLAPLWLPGLAEAWVLWARRDRSWADADATRLTAELGALTRPVADACALELACAATTAFLDQASWITGRLAHDVGNLLTGIFGFTELALGQMAPDSPPHHYLKEVWQSSQLGAQWVRQLQLFGRRAAVNQVPSSVTRAISAALAETADMSKSHSSATIAAPIDLPPVAMEHDSLRQVLSVLLANAYEATPSGTIALTARVVELDEPACLRWIGQPQPGPAVEVAVADPGIGLTPEVRSKLFRELFFSTKPRHRGLGLAVAFGLVDAYQGGLRLEDNNPRGAIARIVLPAAAAAAPADVPAPDAPLRAKADAPHRPARILVVDDDPVIVQFVCAQLATAGHDAQGVSTPQGALEHCQRGTPFDLVISDVRMPGMTGFQLARLVRQHDPQARFVFISSHAANSGDPLLAEFDLVSKPFAAPILMQAVRRALASKTGDRRPPEPTSKGSTS